MMGLKTIKWLKRFGIGVLVFLMLYWLSIAIAIELMRYQKGILEMLASIESIRHWFLLMRLAIYGGFYFTWGGILKKLKPDTSPEIIIETRKFLVRFFIVYELFFGIHVIAFSQH